MDSSASETAELSCVGPSKDGGGTRSGLGLSDIILRVVFKASCRRRRTVLSWEDDGAVLTESVLLARDDVFDSRRRCVRPSLELEALESVE
jgi:hypothetical protein